MIQSGNPSLKRLPTCHGIFGFVRFLHGYYMCLITAVKKVATLGGHLVYSIEDTSLVPVPRHLNEALDPEVAPTKAKKYLAQEKKYRSYFGLFDVRKNFYFSYTLDLSRTLQNLMIRTRDGLPAFQPRSRYIWNHFLLKPFLEGDPYVEPVGAAAASSLRSRRLWVVQAIHGFYEQTLCSLYGKRICLTLVSRRSRYFAGTRYLKRGVNDDGQVANDVETEQILHDRTRGNSHEGDFCSYVQLRASIPVFWCQESNAMVAKPPILVHRSDPLYMATRLHISDLFLRYGSPLLALNLVRQQEKTPREMIIGQVFGEAVGFLNQFLPKPHAIDYLAWDFKKHSRMRQVSVVDELAVIAHWAVQRTGLFHPHPRPDSRQVRAQETMHIKPSHESLRGLDVADANVARLQKGVLRVNCIDSLDRTNVAQFVVGKCALGYMLYALGFTPPPTKHEASKAGGGGLSSSVSVSHFPVASELVQVLLAMYERMGDRLAFQYGGSQMHRQMKKDRAKSMPMKKTSVPLADKPKEMLVSLMRHYQNSFQDTSKQDAINLFLGRYIPSRESEDSTIWELNSDYYLHHKSMEEVPFLAGRCVFADDSWWRSALRKHEEEDGDIEGVQLVDEILPVLPFQLPVRVLAGPPEALEWRRPGQLRTLSSNNPSVVVSDTSEDVPEPPAGGAEVAEGGEMKRREKAEEREAITASGEGGGVQARTKSTRPGLPQPKPVPAVSPDHEELFSVLAQPEEELLGGQLVSITRGPLVLLARDNSEPEYDVTRTHPGAWCASCGRLAEPVDIYAPAFDEERPHNLSLGNDSLSNSSFGSAFTIGSDSPSGANACTQAASHFFWSQAQLQRESRLHALQLAQAKARERLAEEARAVGAAAYTAVLAAAGLQQGEAASLANDAASSNHGNHPPHQQHKLSPPRQQSEQQEDQHQQKQKDKEKQEKEKQEKKDKEEERELLEWRDGGYDASRGPHPAALFTCVCESLQQLNGMLKFQHLYPSEVLEGFDSALQDPLCRPHYVRVLGAGESKRSMIAERLRRFGTAAAGLVMPVRRSPNPSPAHQQGQRGDKRDGMLMMGPGGEHFKSDALLPIEPLRDLALIDLEALRRAEVPTTQDLFSRYARFGFRDAMIYEQTVKEHEKKQEKEQQRQQKQQQREQLRHKERLQAARLQQPQRKASLGSPWIVLFPENKAGAAGGPGGQASGVLNHEAPPFPVNSEAIPSTVSSAAAAAQAAAEAAHSAASAALCMPPPDRAKQLLPPGTTKFSADLAGDDQQKWWAKEGDSVPPTPNAQKRKDGRSSRAGPVQPEAGGAGASRSAEDGEGLIEEEEIVLEEEEEETVSLDSPHASPLKEEHFKSSGSTHRQGTESPDQTECGGTDGVEYWHESPVKVCRGEEEKSSGRGGSLPGQMRDGGEVFFPRPVQSDGLKDSPVRVQAGGLQESFSSSSITHPLATSSSSSPPRITCSSSSSALTSSSHTSFPSSPSSATSMMFSRPGSPELPDVAAPSRLYAPGRSDLGDNPLSKANLAVFLQYTKFGLVCRDDWLEQSFKMEQAGEVAQPVHFELHNKSLDFYAGYRQETYMAPVGPTFSHSASSSATNLFDDAKRTSPVRKQSAAAYAAKKRHVWNWSPTKPLQQQPPQHIQQQNQQPNQQQLREMQHPPMKVSIDQFSMSPSHRAAEAAAAAAAVVAQRAKHSPPPDYVARRRLWSGDSTDSNEDMKDMSYGQASALANSLAPTSWDHVAYSESDYVSTSAPGSPVSSTSSVPPSMVGSLPGLDAMAGLADYSFSESHRGGAVGTAGKPGRHPTLGAGADEERLVLKASTSRQAPNFPLRMSPSNYPRPPPPGSIRAVEEPDSEDEEELSEPMVLSASSLFLRATRDSTVDLLTGSDSHYGSLVHGQPPKRGSSVGSKRREQGSPTKPRFDLNS
eukprot:gb/GEZN01000160.1/.p1 GENE.gb/GEZN01000160.1/~~gb/GEZN01000160.1/.p1  ORF type:complete len:2070 (-),score=443.97 gb/GEZN01000160.1/:126-5888(-)